MIKEGALFVITPKKKYIEYKEYIIVLSRDREPEYEYTAITLLYKEWFKDKVKMQRQIDRHL